MVTPCSVSTQTKAYLLLLLLSIHEIELVHAKSNFAFNIFSSPPGRKLNTHNNGKVSKTSAEADADNLSSALQDAGSCQIPEPIDIPKSCQIPSSSSSSSTPPENLLSKCYTDTLTSLTLRGGAILPTILPPLQSTPLTSSMPVTISAIESMGLLLPLTTWKIIYQILLTTLNIAFWLVPLNSPTITSSPATLSLLSTFSGGVFLSLSLTHLLPEAVESFMKLKTDGVVGDGVSDVLPYGLVLFGYMLIFFVEKIAFDTAAGVTPITPVAPVAPVLTHADLHHVPSNKLAAKPPSSTSHAVSTTTPPTPQTQSSSSSQITTHLQSSRSALLLLLALSVHSILEMTALGLSRTFPDSTVLTISIALHQPAESISLLIAFLKSGMPKAQIFKYLLVFSFMGPVGCFVGLMVKNLNIPLADVMMLSTVAGTFLYVGATEVVPEEFEGNGEDKVKKFLSLCAGIGMVMVVTGLPINLGLRS